MAKSKKSKILASMLAVSTMAVFYAAPVMAGSVDSITGDSSGIHFDFNYEKDNNTSISDGVITGSDGLYITGSEGNEFGGITHKIVGKFTIASQELINALENKTFKNLTINNLDTDTLTVDGTTVDLTQFKDVDLSNVKGIKRINVSGDKGTTVLEETLTVNGSTGEIYNSAATFKVDRNGKITAGNLSSTGRTGGWYVEDIQTGTDTYKTMIYAAPKGGSSTLRIDPENGNLSMEGSLAVVGEKGSWDAPTTIIDGKTGNVAVGSNIHLNADNGAVTASAYNGVTLATDGNKVLVADIDIAKDHANVAGIERDPVQDTTTIEGTLSVDSTGVITHSSDAFGIGADGSLTAAAGSNIGGVEFNGDGNVTGNNFIGNNFVTTSGADLDTVANNTAGIRRTQNANGNDVTIIEDYFKVYDDGTINAANGNFKVNPNGGVTAKSVNLADGFFTVSNNGVNVANNNLRIDNTGNIHLEDGIKVDGVDISELSTNVTNTNKNVAGIERVDANSDGTDDTTVIEKTLAVTEDGIAMNKGDMLLSANEAGFAAVKGDNQINLNEYGVNLTAGKDNFISVTEDGIGLQGGTSKVILNSNNGTVFTNGEANGTTVINGGAITAETLNGKNINDLVVGSDIADDLSNVAGIERVDANGDGTDDTTVIEKTLAVTEDGIAMNKGDVLLSANEAGFAVVKGNNQFNLNEHGVNLTAGNNVISMTDDGIGFKGTVYAGEASDFHFTYGGYGANNAYAGNYTLEDLADAVADIHDRTQGISYDKETGTTTIDGNLDVKGDVSTGEGGNMNAESGTIGDVTMSDGNINTDGVVNAGEGGTIGGVTMDKDGNINTDGVINAGGGTIGDVTMSDGKVTAGQTTVSNDGVSIADSTIISDHDVVINKGTENEVSLSDVGNRVGNLEQGVADLNSRVNHLEDRIDKVGAMAAAIANLRTMGYDPAAPTEVAVGVGQYRDETGAALGLFHYPNRDFMLSLSVSTSGDEVMGGIGATWKFGRKSPEKVAEIKKAQAEADVRRAEEAKLAKAEEMKKAAKEAKIKAQMERHAKLAAERAAQAEAK